ncbi:hypothetical protein [Alicyclobacillus shizuokensis]|uniref:hypothetical protein n=1 Tax=Alicyclobacillus shizuokensis TaxID=392014 RepID=UPI00082A3862|nr:hypothetical protein [Alicyclobacillus shizuokensis]MCL6626214.1 hypothetical protein [Alicyclobacillus shizuokensis]
MPSISILEFVLTMSIPLCIGFYTYRFGRWVSSKGSTIGSVSAYVLAVVSLSVSGVVLWRMMT